MRTSSMRTLALLLVLSAPAFAQAPKPGEKRPISDAEKADLQAKIDGLDRALDGLKGKTFGEDVRPSDVIADASVSLKAARWILKHGEFYNADSVAKTVQTLDLGTKRAEEL